MIKLPKVIANSTTTKGPRPQMVVNGPVVFQKNIQVRGIEQTVKQEPVEPTRRWAH